MISDFSIGIIVGIGIGIGIDLPSELN